MSWRVLACGERALLVELDGLDAVLALDAAVRASGKAGHEGLAEVIDVVPGARTLLLVLREGAEVESLRRALPALVRGAADARAGVTPEGRPREVEIRVHYDGPDLGEVAELTGLSAGDVVAAHTGTPWRAAFTGFAPGFAYLAGGDSRLRVPRRSEPRTSVPAGSVGLAGEFSAVYPGSSPGGWQLIGRTEATLWDLERESPALIDPGSVVRFVDADAGSADATEAVTGAGNARRLDRRSVRRERAEGPVSCATPALEVVRPGLLSLVQDLGRPGLAALGVGPSGAADRASFRLGARLLAQDDTAAAIEVTFGGLEVRARRDLMMALTGAPAPATVDDVGVGHLSPFVLREGQTLRLSAPPVGLRTYLSVRGGIDVAAVLGSRATDVLSGIGPEPLRVGDLLPVGPPPQTLPNLDIAPMRALTGGQIVVRALLGPRDDGWRTRERSRRRRGRSPAVATVSAYAWRGQRCSATPHRSGWSWRAKVSSGGRSRSHPAGNRSSSSPTTR